MVVNNVRMYLLGSTGLVVFAGGAAVSGGGGAGLEGGSLAPNRGQTSGKCGVFRARAGAGERAAQQRGAIHDNIFTVVIRVSS